MNNNAVTIPFLDLTSQFESIRDEIMDAVDRVFVSGQFVGGEWVERFEEQFARFVGSKYAIGVGVRNAALELALKAAQIGAGDEVILPANSFFATAEAVSNVGARPVFADVNPMTFHLDVASVERLITAEDHGNYPCPFVWPGYGHDGAPGIGRAARAHNHRRCCAGARDRTGWHSA